MPTTRPGRAATGDVRSLAVLSRVPQKNRRTAVLCQWPDLARSMARSSTLELHCPNGTADARTATPRFETLDTTNFGPLLRVTLAAEASLRPSCTVTLSRNFDGRTPTHASTLYQRPLLALLVAP